MPTAEVRWFFNGAVPEEIERWFGGGGLAATAAPREDHYMLFPASLGLNVKLREGRLEIKSLVKALGARTLAADIAGHVQMWEKRAGGNAAFAHFERLRTSTPHLWIAVRKDRTLRKFAPEGDSIKEVEAGKVFLAEGCNAELTGITVDGKVHWSLAFEAYGEPVRVEASLMRTAAHVLTDRRRPPGAFSADNSRSYPEWLEQFSKKG